MSIKVISQSTSERKQETIDLYNKCKPLLEQGYSLYRAAYQIRGTKPTNTKNGWYKDLIDYAILQGHDYYGKRWNRITVVERSTSDVDKETVELFEECKPYLDKGWGFYKTLRHVKNIPETSCFGNLAWYRRFREYAATQGYYPQR